MCVDSMGSLGVDSLKPGIKRAWKLTRTSSLPGSMALGWGRRIGVSSFAAQALASEANDSDVGIPIKSFNS